MSDETVESNPTTEETGGNPTGLFNPHNVMDDDDFEVILPGQPGYEPESTDEYSKKSKEEILAELKAQKDQIASLGKQADTSQALLAGLRELKGTASPQYYAPPPPVADQYKPLTAEEVNPNFIDNPYDATQKIVQDQLRKLDPALQKNLLLAKEMSRKFAYLDPDSKSMLDLYGQEVEQQVAATPIADQLGNVNLYQDAIKTVKMRHFEDIQDKAIQAALAKQKAEFERAGQSGQTRSRPSFNETTSRPVPPKAARRASADDVKKAQMLGMDLKDYLRSAEMERGE